MAVGRRVVLGVTGGIAAYKAAYLARLLTERGATVRVVMTETAREFIGTATFAAITGSEPVTSLFGGDDVSPHTTLGQWAEAIVVAPATASTLSKLAHGESSNALTATVLASSAPVVVAPAMHTEMWEQPAIQHTMAKLRDYGYTIVEPESGLLAGGDVGMGRLADPTTIADVVYSLFPAPDLAGLNVMITAGGTREAIDPVRYIGNRSSGKMGNAIATVASERGASVLLITAAEPPTGTDIEVVRVETADEMAEAVTERTSGMDVAVMAAAVADFKPRKSGPHKIRRADGVPKIELVPTPDVLMAVHTSSPRPFLVGFAAETGSVDAAVAKAATKGVDLLVANDISKEGSGFGSDTNEVRFVFADGTVRDLELMTKREVASEIWDAVMSLRAES
ncbi:MAG: bifunctional phosphopantothenoylcysteine decarboxylase/phosphopantothenate--cysteine ligase CoaBC [Acidimicrobiia bacterium]|nr:MAG: bifunctional phosphopantothenoylcysteine decarboxylase/phosphopantothenate--cysteine ligase CoaBC [Acidimicrobiia bacterium]